MSNEVAIRDQFYLDDRDMDLLRRSKYKVLTDDQWDLFKSVCKHLKLSPLLNQIHPVPRENKKQGGYDMTIQTGIDGYRLMAERTGKVLPGRAATFEHDKNGRLLSATAYVKRLGPDGQWHEVSHTAFFDEYVATDFNGNPIAMWKKMPRGQLAKCAESGALRKAAPYDEFAVVRTDEEMEQADAEVIEVKSNKVHPLPETTKPVEIGNKPVEKITSDQALELSEKIGDALDYRAKIFNHYKISSFTDLPATALPVVQKRIDEFNAERLEKEMSNRQPEEQLEAANAEQK